MSDTEKNQETQEKQENKKTALVKVPRASVLPTVALVVAFIAIALLAWQWLENHRLIATFEASLSQRLSELDNRSRESQLLAKKAEESGTQSNARLSLIEQKLAESQNQQDALQILYMEFANNRDERIISEVEQLVSIASEQLQLAANVKSALIALQTADIRLQQLDRPQTIKLRKLIANDIQKLQAVPLVDTVGISLRLEGMADIVDTLPLISERHPGVADNGINPDYDSNAWRRLAGEIWQDLRHMIRIERIDHPEPPLLAPDQAYFLRENLRLRLLTARIALLQRDESTYHADLRSIEAWLKRHFDTTDVRVQNTISTIHQLAGSVINIQPPDITETLNAAGRYKLALEKGK